jgi:hypothetical protein
MVEARPWVMDFHPRAVKTRPGAGGGSFLLLIPIFVEILAGTISELK